jgi:beta-RFAP synthase
VKVIVEAPARLHLGFLDLGGQCGRLFGSIGVALERPRWVVEAVPAERATADGESAPEVLAVLERLGRDAGGVPPVAIRTVEGIPRHVGFGSGTQLGLAVALAASRATGRSVEARELAPSLGRGQRSGIGIAVFARGGFVVDAGRRSKGAAVEGLGAAGDDEVPPVVFQHPLPGDWFFVLVTPAGAQGLSGAAEAGIFATLPPMAEDRIGRICRLALMTVIPAVMTDDIDAFGAAITEIQGIVGEYFAPHQGGVYATATGREVADFAMRHGACGVGQSSWGPTVFVVVRGEPCAARLAAAIRAHLGDDRSAVSYTPARNHGATWRVET